MKQQLLQASLFLIGLTMITGCTSKPVHEQVSDNAVEFSEYRLDPNEGYSESLERMYLLSQANPVKENNLDSFDIGKNYHAANDLSLSTGAVFTALGKINIFQLATHSLINMANSSSLHYRYQNNLLVVVEPVVNGNIKEALYQAKQRSLKIIGNAYGKSTINTKVFSDKEVAYINTYDTTFTVPFNLEQIVPYCSTPDGYKSIGSTANLKNSNIGCYGMTFGVGTLYQNNTDDTKFPFGDFVITHSVLPAIFPIENLRSDSKYDWVYQPSFTFFSGKWKENFAEFNEKTFTHEYKKGRFVINPKITLLKSGKTYNFHKNTERCS